MEQREFKQSQIHHPGHFNSLDEAASLQHGTSLVFAQIAVHVRTSPQPNIGRSSPGTFLCLAWFLVQSEPGVQASAEQAV